MLRKIVYAVLGLIIAGGAIGWFNRNAIMTALLMRRIEATKEYVAPNREVVWDQGPSQADTPVSQRPPNVVFILFDDFGYDVTPVFHPASTRDRPLLSRRSAGEATGRVNPARCFSSSAAKAAGVA